MNGTPNLSAEDLCSRVGKGDDAAFSELYSRYRSQVASALRRTISDTGRVEDLTQEVFLDVWRGAARFDRRQASFSTWLRTIVARRSIDAMRRASVRPVFEAEEKAQPTTEDPTERIALGLTMKRALLAIPDAQRRTLELAFLHDLSYGEIARRTGTPHATVKSRAAAGLRRLEVELAA